MGYCIMRMAKVKSRAGLVGRLKHNTREFLTPNVDHGRSGQNWVSAGDAVEVMARYSQLLPDKVRKNAVHAVELVMTASPDFSGSWEDYLKNCDRWACRLFGKENLLHVAHHFDETTPHTQIIFMPLKDGKLNAKHFIGGTRDRMSELQDDFYQKVGYPAGLERGVSKSKTRARHTPHTLAGKAALLEKREEELDNKFNEAVEKETKLISSTKILMQVQKLHPVEIKKMQDRLQNLDNQTPDSLQQFARMIQAKGFKTVGEYRKAQEARQDREQSRSRSSFSR